MPSTAPIAPSEAAEIRNRLVLFAIQGDPLGSGHSAADGAYPTVMKRL